MLHRLALALLLLTGCFRNHGAGGDGPAADAGLADGGAGPWASCRAADEGGGRDGDPCSFEGACFGDGVCSSTTTSCEGGRLSVERFVDERCPTSCADLEGVGDPSGLPCEVAFGPCTLSIDECCLASYRCERGSVAQIGATICDTDCVGGGVCEGWAPPPPEGIPCTADADCDPAAFEYCLPPGESPDCPVCSTDERACVSDADCPDGAHCEEYEPPCPPCGGIDPTICVEDCVPGSCPEGQECTAGGACVPLRCDTGAIECPENFRCTASSGDGCRRLDCERDSDCDCGSCIEGRCHDGPGVCREPSA